MKPLRAAALSLTGLTALQLFAAPRPAAAQVFVSWRVSFAPPPLPVYVQPPVPGPDYIWTPGYWAWDDDVGDYCWVPGAWVLAPQPGLLWTPGWWGWDDGVYAWHGGYWGPRIGWYGGVNYGFGYTGYGFAGGYWSGRHFFYNRAVVNVTNVNITNVYTQTVVNQTAINRVSFNGPGGVNTRPTPAQLAAVPPQERVAPTPMQARHVQMALATPQLRAAANHGAPPIAATPVAAQFHAAGVVRARPEGAPANAASREYPNGANPLTTQRFSAGSAPPRYDGTGPERGAREPGYGAPRLGNTQRPAPGYGDPRFGDAERGTPTSFGEALAPQPHSAPGERLPGYNAALMLRGPNERPPSYPPRPQGAPRPLPAYHAPPPRPQPRPQAEHRPQKPGERR